jgi:ABC-type multidrug transport system fused ATPase/permease subunit
MLSQLKKIYNILKPQHKKQIFIIQIFVILSSLMEVSSVVAVGQFISLISNINNLEKIEFFFKVYNYFFFTNNIIFTYLVKTEFFYVLINIITV